MKPLELQTSPFRCRNESQLQPRCEDNRVHRVRSAAALALSNLRVIDTVDWCVCPVPLSIVEAFVPGTMAGEL